MRVLLSTLAVMAFISPAMAYDMNNNPEGSIEQSTVVTHQAIAAEPVAQTAMNSNKADAMAKMEPAAGVMVSSGVYGKTDAEMYSDAEGTVIPSRTVE